MRYVRREICGKKTTTLKYIRKKMTLKCIRKKVTLRFVGRMNTLRNMRLNTTKIYARR